MSSCFAGGCESLDQPVACHGIRFARASPLTGPGVVGISHIPPRMALSLPD